MTRATSNETSGGMPDDGASDDDVYQARNFWTAVCYSVLLRTGWIFKTESVIMPAVLDVMGGSEWLRGCLPMLNRFGQSVPPLLISDRVRNSSLKKIGLFASSMTMGVCFLILSFVWGVTGGAKSVWLPIVFLVIYGIFFSATGVNQLVFYTISGKLIRANHRGRLSLMGAIIGSSIAVTCAWYLLGIWLVDQTGPGGEQSNFSMIFGFTGIAFVASALVALFLKERRDHEPEEHRSGKELIRAAILTIRYDRNFRRLTIIASLFGMYLTLFPHYQSLGRGRLGLGLTSLIPWVLAQNIGAALFSFPAGWVADRYGNRLVLRCIMLVLCVAPVLALILVRWGGVGQMGFAVVFCLLGLTPVTMRVLNNYTLEIAGRSDHPRYLSTLSIAIAIPPVFLSAFFGLLIRWYSFELVFSIVVACVFCGWLLTFSIKEPRRSPS